jgi:hypothetical protein
LFPQSLYAFENIKTHPALTDKAATASILDNYLKNQLRLNDAITTELYWDFPESIKDRMDLGYVEPEKTTRAILEWIGAIFIT